MMGRIKQKIKNNLIQIKLIVIIVAVLASLGLIIHNLRILNTKAYFRNSQDDYVTLTVTGDVYNSIIGQLPQLDDTDTQMTVPEHVYNQIP